jgi:hypothetical protein
VAGEEPVGAAAMARSEDRGGRKEASRGGTRRAGEEPGGRAGEERGRGEQGSMGAGAAMARRRRGGARPREGPE